MKEQTHQYTSSAQRRDVLKQEHQELRSVEEVRSCTSTSKCRGALTEEPSNSMESFVMHAVPGERDIAPTTLKRPDDKVQRTEEFDFPPIWQRGASMTSPSMKATSGSKMEPDDPSLTAHAFLITVHQIANDSAVRTRCAQSKPPTELTEPTSEHEHLAFASLTTETLCFQFRARWPRL